jgi:hypothetical protein
MTTPFGCRAEPCSRLKAVSPERIGGSVAWRRIGDLGPMMPPTPPSIPSRNREPLTAERAAALAEVARREGRIEDALRLEKIARELRLGNSPSLR